MVLLVDWRILRITLYREVPESSSVNSNLRPWVEQLVIVYFFPLLIRIVKVITRSSIFSMECGMTIENYNDIKVGDVIEAFQIDEVAASLE